jgi:hypothetical protein
MAAHVTKDGTWVSFMVSINHVFELRGGRLIIGQLRSAVLVVPYRVFHVGHIVWCGVLFHRHIQTIGPAPGASQHVLGCIGKYIPTSVSPIHPSLVFMLLYPVSTLVSFSGPTYWIMGARSPTGGWIQPVSNSQPFREATASVRGAT